MKDSDRCRVSEDELRNDLHGMQLQTDYKNAEDKALRRLKSAGFDSETFMNAIYAWTPEDWEIVLDMTQNDYCSLGLKIKEAVYEQLVKECLGE